MDASADRTRSTALRCTIVSIQAIALPRAGSNATGGPPDLEERLLGDLLGLRRVAHDPDGEAEDPRRGGVVQARERCLVAPSGEPEQLAEVAAAADAPSGEGAPAGTGRIGST